MELLLGCGLNRIKKLYVGNRSQWKELVTVDFNEDHKPDVVWDLECLPLPFGENSADEIHLYDVLEHTGSIGDWRFFFNQFSDFWRILKPNCYLFAVTPMWNGIWAFGDPSHKRIINRGSLSFLHQKEYTKQVGYSPMTDYRFIYKADFETVHCNETDSSLEFVLKAIK